MRVAAATAVGRPIEEPLDPGYPLRLVALPRLMDVTSGTPEMIVGLIDGPIAVDHPDLAAATVRIPGPAGACREPGSASCRHGTFVAGILAARRGAQAPAIAPDCTLLVRPVFSEAEPIGEVPSATPRELAGAIVDCVDSGARVLNLSAAIGWAPIATESEVKEALLYTMRRGVLVIAAAGNEGVVGGSAITRHPWVIPIVGYARSGWPLAQSNLGRSMGIGGVGAAGEGVISLAAEGGSTVSAGTSIATPFVSGAAALLWSVFPDATAVEVKEALLSSSAERRRTVAPPLLNAWRAYELLSGARGRRAIP